MLRKLVVRVAVAAAAPLGDCSRAVPRVAVPSRKVTRPVAMPELEPLAATVAVKATCWPLPIELLLEVTVVVVLAWVMVCVAVLAMLAVQLPSPR